MQVLCVLMSVGGVTFVSFYSNVAKDCQDPSQSHNHTQTSNDSYRGTLDQMVLVSHLNPKGVTCNAEPSTPLGYIVRFSLSLSPSLPPSPLPPPLSLHPPPLESSLL